MEVKESLVKGLRKLRKLHRYLGLSVAFFLFISAITGIFLSLKKDVNLIQPQTAVVTSESSSSWLSVEILKLKGLQGLAHEYPDQSNNSIDRLDVRPDKGIAKVLFKNGYWEVQLDGKTGEVLSVGKRHSDWIEALHDGSIVSKTFKLIVMNYLGLGVIILLFTGIYLWWGPRRIRFSRRRR